MGSEKRGSSSSRRVSYPVLCCVVLIGVFVFFLLRLVWVGLVFVDFI